MVITWIDHISHALNALIFHISDTLLQRLSRRPVTVAMSVVEAEAALKVAVVDNGAGRSGPLPTTHVVGHLLVGLRPLKNEVAYCFVVALVHFVN